MLENMLERWRLSYLATAAMALLLAVSCATGAVADNDDGSSSGAGAGVPAGPLPGYRFRQKLTVTDNTPAAVAVPFEFDHATLVADGKAKADGSDVRVTYETPDGTVVQLDRVLDPLSKWNVAHTRVWLRTTAVVDGAGSYYVYYGNDGAGSAPADGTAVYDYWDDFEDGELDSGWVFTGLSGATGMVTQQGGALRITATAQDFGGTSDQIGVALRQASGDFRVELALRKAGGSLGGLSKAGGLTLRQSNTADSRHATIAIQQTPDKRVHLFRAADGAAGTSDEIENSDAYPHVLGLYRSGDDVTVSYYQGGNWLQLNVTQTFTEPLVDPVLIGVPFSNKSGGDGWAEVEWIRLNKFVSPMPSGLMDGNEESF